MRIIQGLLVASSLATATLLSVPAIAAESQAKSPSLIQFAEPAGMPRWAYSHSVVTPASLKLVSVDHIVPTDTTGDLKAQIASAFTKLDAVLAAHGADRSSIVVLDTHVVGTQLRFAQAASDGMKGYFDGHLNGNTPFSAHDYPVRTTSGEAAIDGTNTQVALDVKFVDPKANAGVQTASGERLVNFGGISAQQPDFTITGYGDPAAEARAAVANLKKVLAVSGMTLANVKELNIQVSDPAVAAYNAGQMIVASNGASPAQKTAPVSAVEAAVKQGISAALKAEGVNPETVNYRVVAAACASAAFKVDVSGTARG